MITNTIDKWITEQHFNYDNEDAIVNNNMYYNVLDRALKTQAFYTVIEIRGARNGNIFPVHKRYMSLLWTLVCDWRQDKDVSPTIMTC